MENRSKKVVSAVCVVMLILVTVMNVWLAALRWELRGLLRETERLKEELALLQMTAEEQEEITAPVPFAEDTGGEDPTENMRSFEALLAKCQVVRDCQIVGYAPELIEGWSDAWRSEQGLYLTASGKWAAPGTCVATDPAVIPTGATVIIGDKVYIAADTGVRGKVIDVMVTVEEAKAFGCRTEDVYWCMEAEG